MSYFWKKMDYTSAEPHIVKLLEGMQHRKPANTNVMYSRGCDWTEEIETKFSELGDERAWEYDILHRKVDAGETADEDEALRMAREADVIVAAMGENVMLCGENRDRQGLHLPGKQAQYVEKLIQTGKPVVLVMFGGRAQVVEKPAAFVQILDGQNGFVQRHAALLLHVFCHRKFPPPYKKRDETAHSLLHPLMGILTH
jgi:beta-glucosidase